MDYFIHPHGLCESLIIGRESKVLAHCHIYSGAKIGEKCVINDGSVIEDDVSVGNGVVIGCSVVVSRGVQIGDDASIGDGTIFCRDVDDFDKGVDSGDKTVVETNAVIGAGCVISSRLVVGRNSFIRDGSVVTRSVPPFAIVFGNPAEIVGYVTSRSDVELVREFHENFEFDRSKVLGVSFKEFPCFQDMRGSLAVGNFGSDIPFVPKRYFLVFNVPSQDVRGEHAHKECLQFLVCVSGSVKVVVDNGVVRQEFVLNKNNKGLFLPAMIWASQYAYSKDAVLLVFASHDYDPEDYIRDYQEFVSLIEGQGAHDE